MMPVAPWGSWVLRQPVWRLLAALTALHVAAVALFSSGFLLTRVELTQRSCCDNVGCEGPADGIQRPGRPQQCFAMADKESSGESSAAAGEGTSTGASAGGHGWCTAGAEAVAADPQPNELNNQAEGEAGVGSCCGAPHFNKTLWLIIDALRFDFVLCDPSAAGLDIQHGNDVFERDPPPPHGPPPLSPHVQRMRELLSLARDWVRTAVSRPANRIPQQCS